MIRAAAFFYIIALALSGGSAMRSEPGATFDHADDAQYAKQSDGRSSPPPSVLGSGKNGRRVKRSQALTIKDIHIMNKHITTLSMNPSPTSAAKCTVPRNQNKAKKDLLLSVSVKTDGSLACKAKTKGDYVGNIDDVIVTLTNGHSKVFATVQDDSLFIADSKVGRVAEYGNRVAITYSSPTRRLQYNNIQFATEPNDSHHLIKTPKGILLSINIMQGGETGELSKAYVGVMDGLDPSRKTVHIKLYRRSLGFFKRGPKYIAYSTGPCEHCPFQGIYMENQAIEGQVDFTVYKGTDLLPVTPFGFISFSPPRRAKRTGTD